MDGAWVDYRGETRRLTAPGPTTEAEALLCGYYPNVFDWEHNPQRSLRHRRLLSSAYASTRSPGAAALDLAHVAAGWAGAAMGTTMKPWDVAAGIHLVRQAGGEVFTFDRGTGVPEHLRGAYVACGPSLHPETALQVLAELVASE